VNRIKATGEKFNRSKLIKENHVLFIVSLLSSPLHSNLNLTSINIYILVTIEIISTILVAIFYSSPTMNNVFAYIAMVIGIVTILLDIFIMVLSILYSLFILFLKIYIGRNIIEIFFRSGKEQNRSALSIKVQLTTLQYHKYSSLLSLLSLSLFSESKFQFRYY
jgi:hypothetical protein